MYGDENQDQQNPDVPEVDAPEVDTPEEGDGQQLSLNQAYDRIASKYGVPTTVWKAMINQESGGNTQAVSGAGARGAWQVMPATFRGLGYNPDTDFDNPLKVAEAGLRILRDNYRRFRPNARDEAHAWQMAIAGYHTNPNNVARNLAGGGDGIPNTYDPAAKITTRQHVAKIFQNVDLGQLNRTPSGGSINTEGQPYEIPPMPRYSQPGQMPVAIPKPGDIGPQQPITTEQQSIAPPPVPQLPKTVIPSPSAPRRGEVSQEDLYYAGETPAPRTDIPETPKLPDTGMLPYAPPRVSYGGPLPPEGGQPQAPGVLKPEEMKPTQPGTTAPSGAGTPGQQRRGKQVKDNQGNVYEIAPNQSGVPKGSTRWILREGPEATITADSFGGITFIQQGNRVIREDRYNANEKAKKVYEEQDKDVAQRIGDGFYVNTGGASFTVPHLQALAKGNTALEKRIQALIQQTPGAMDAALRPNVGYAAPVTIRVPYALQAALELNRQGIQFGNVNPESLIQQAINKGSLKFQGDRLTIGREQALTLLNASRPARRQAADRIIQDIESGAPTSPEYWEQAQRAAGTTLLAHDPRIPFAMRENQKAIDANEARIAEFGPSIQKYTEEARAALASPEKAAEYSRNFNLPDLRKVPTEYRNAMAQILGQWKAGTLGLTQAQAAINRLYKEGSPIYQQAETTLAQRQGRSAAITAASQARFGEPDAVVPSYEIPKPSDTDIQDYILRTGQVLTEDERRQLRLDWMTRPADWKTSVIGAGVAAAGGNTSRMLLGMFEDILPTQTVREWRAFNERAEVKQEAIQEREDRGWWKNLAQTVVSTVADLPRFYLMELTGAGLPAIFAGDAMLQAKGSGASEEEILKQGAIGGAMGTVLWGAGKFGGFAKNWALAKGTPSLEVFAQRMSNYAKSNPEFAQRVGSMMRAIIKNRENKEALIPFGAKIGSGRALTREEEMRVLFDVLKKSDRPALTTQAERNWELASKFSPLVEVGTVLTGVYGIQRASGASEKQSEDEAIKMAILHMGMSYGGKLVGPIAKRLEEAYDKLKGKWFRVNDNGKTTDAIIDPNGTIYKAETPLDPKLIEAEIKVPPPGEMPGGQGVTAPTPKGPTPPTPGGEKPTVQVNTPEPGWKTNPNANTALQSNPKLANDPEVQRISLVLFGGKGLSPTSIARTAQIPVKDIQRHIDNLWWAGLIEYGPNGKVRWASGQAPLHTPERGKGTPPTPTGGTAQPPQAPTTQPPTAEPPQAPTAQPPTGEPPVTTAPPAGQAPVVTPPPAGQAPVVTPPTGKPGVVGKKGKGGKKPPPPTGGAAAPTPPPTAGGVTVAKPTPPAKPPVEKPVGRKGGKKVAAPEAPKVTPPPSEAPGRSLRKAPPEETATQKAARRQKQIAAVDEIARQHQQNAKKKIAPKLGKRAEPIKIDKTSLPTFDELPFEIDDLASRIVVPEDLITKPMSAIGGKGQKPPEALRDEYNKIRDGVERKINEYNTAAERYNAALDAGKTPKTLHKTIERLAKEISQGNDALARVVGEMKDRVARRAEREATLSKKPATQKGPGKVDGTADGKLMKLPSNLPKVTDIPQIIRGKGTPQETNSRELARQFLQSIKDTVKEYNDAIKKYNKARAENKPQDIKYWADEANDAIDGLKDRIRRLLNLKEGKPSYGEERAGAELTKPVQPKGKLKPRGKKAEEVEPVKPEPSTKIELEAVPGRQAKIGDTVYKPFPYAPNGYFEGKVIKNPYGDKEPYVVYENPRTGRKTKIPLSDAWSVNKPVPKKGVKPAPKTTIDENEVVHWTDEKGLKSILDNDALEGGSVTTSLDLPFDIDNKLQFGIVLDKDVVDKYGFKSLSEDTLGATKLEKQFELRGTEKVPMTEAQIAFVVRNKKTADALRKILDEYGLGDAEIRIAKKPKYKTLDEKEKPTPEEEAPTVVEEEQPEPTGGDVVGKGEEQPEPTGGGLGPDDFKAWAEALHPMIRAEIRYGLDPENPNPKSVTQIAYEMGIPWEVVDAVPKKGPLGPFGQASYKMRGWMEDASLPFIDDLAKALKLDIDTTTPEKRATAANVVMDKLAEIGNVPRSSKLNKSNYDKIYEALIPKVTEDTALRIIEAAEWQSNYSKAIRELQTNPLWRKLTEAARQPGVESWDDLPKSLRKELRQIGRIIGDQFGNRTYNGKTKPLFTEDALRRAFNETLARRGRPLFEDALPEGNIQTLANKIRNISKESFEKIDNSPNAPFSTDSNGTVRSRTGDTIGTSLDIKSFQNRLSQLAAAAIEPQSGKLHNAAMAELERQRQVIVDSMVKLSSKPINDILKNIEYIEIEPGVFQLNPEGMFYINDLELGSPTAANGLYIRNTPTNLRNNLLRINNDGRTLFEAGHIDAANNLWNLGKRISEALGNGPFHDMVAVINHPDAPLYSYNTYLEEMAHRGDLRLREGEFMRQVFRVATPGTQLNAGMIAGLKSLKIALHIPSFNKATPGYKKADAWLRVNGYLKNTPDDRLSEVVAKCLRNDVGRMPITPDERVEIVKEYVRQIMSQNVTPADIHLFFNPETGPYHRELTEIYAKQYTDQLSTTGRVAKGRTRRKTISSAPDASLSAIWRSWSPENDPNTPIPSKYESEISTRKVKGKTETLIKTPNLENRQIFRILKDDGEYLASPNNPEIKLNQEEIDAIQAMDEVRRPDMEDLIYTSRLMNSTVKVKSGNKTIEFFTGDLPGKLDAARDFEIASYPALFGGKPTPKQWRTQRQNQPGRIRKVLGPVAKTLKLGFGLAYHVWGTKTSIRASTDISSLRQAAKGIAAQKMWYREFNAQGKAAMALNEKLMDVERQLLEQQKFAKDSLAASTTPQDKAKYTAEVARLQKELEDNEKKYVDIKRNMSNLRFSFLLKDWFLPAHMGLKQRDWYGKGIGKVPGLRRISGTPEGNVRSMEYYAKTMWNDPNYERFANELGLEYGSIVKPKPGVTVTNGWNTGVIKDYRIGIGTHPQGPDPLIVAKVRKANPEMPLTDIKWDPKTKRWTANVLRVEQKDGKVVPYSFAWRHFGPGTGAGYEIFGHGIFQRAPYFESKAGARTFQKALASGSKKDMLGWIANRGRKFVAKPIQASEDSYSIALAWLRHKMMTYRLKDLTVLYARQGEQVPIEALKAEAQHINRLTGAFKGAEGTKTGRAADSVGKLLRPFMFSWSWQASTMSLFDPRTWVKAPKHVLRSRIAGAVQGAAIYATILAIADTLTDVEVSYDNFTDSANFKLKVGSETTGYKSIDISANFAKYSIALARVIAAIANEFPQEQRGVNVTRKKRGQVLNTIGRIIGNLFWTSANPRTQDMIALATGKTVMGEPTTFMDHFLSTWGPLSVDTFIENFNTEGGSSWYTFMENYGANVSDLSTIKDVEQKRREDWIKYADKPEERQQRYDAWTNKIENLQREQARKQKMRNQPGLWQQFIDVMEDKFAQDANAEDIPGMKQVRDWWKEDQKDEEKDK